MGVGLNEFVYGLLYVVDGEGTVFLREGVVKEDVVVCFCEDGFDFE